MSDAAGKDAGSTERDPIDLLAETFLARVRAGEPLQPAAFAAEHPQQPGLLPVLEAMLALEQIKRDKESTAHGRGRPLLPRLERLGDYRIVREIGRGGMGVVFEAVQQSLGRAVALKVLPHSQLLSGHQLQRFQREAQTAAQLHHSNIVPVFGSGEDQGFHYYAMQFIDGKGLDAWIREQQQARQPGRQRFRFTAEVGAQVAAALQHAHAQGTLHRDIKPSNLLLDAHGVVWVTDFGLAKALEGEGLTHSGDLLGTLQYMAPEQFQGDYEPCSEVYALGVTLHELLTLAPAFQGQQRGELVERIRAGRAASLRSAVPELPRDLETIVHKAMAQAPEDRYASAGALAEDLRRFLADQPILARRHGPAEQLWRWCRTNRALASAAAVALVAVFAAAIVGWGAYVVTDDALQRANASARAAGIATGRAEGNLALALAAFEDVFDSLVGPDPFHALEQDPDTGEYELVVRTAADPKAAALLQRMLAFYDKFAAQNAGNAALQQQTARAYRRVGSIEARLDHLDAAEQAFDKALGLYRFVRARFVMREIAAVHLELGQIGLRRNQPVDAAPHFRQALRILDDDLESGSRLVRYQQARAHLYLAAALQWRPLGPPGPQGTGPQGTGLQGGLQGGSQGPGPPPGGAGQPGANGAEARDHLQRARERIDQLVLEDHDNPEFLELQARCLAALARGRPLRAADATEDDKRRALAEQAIAILGQLVQRFPDNTAYRYELIDVLAPQGAGPRSARPRDGGDPAVLDRLQQACTHADVLRRLLPDDHDAQATWALTHSRHGSALLAAHDLEHAEAELRQALAVEAGLAGGEHAEPRWQLQETMTRLQLARTLLDRGDRDGARAQVDEFAARWRRGPAERPPPLPFGADRQPLFKLLEEVGRGDLAEELRQRSDRRRR
ncbi:MAG TPA: serine/threonine-protein kinase [Planctomycetota bacterium]|nr:serine/threonine-protein kinase [Planctomycetota bacterium]